MELVNIIWLAVIFIILVSIFYSVNHDEKKKYDYTLHYRAPSFKEQKYNR